MDRTGRARGRLPGHHRLAARRDHQRALAGDRSGLGLSDRVPVLLALHRVARAPHRRSPGDARLAAQRRPRLRAHRTQRPVRASLRGHRRRRPAGGPGARGADGLPAGHALDHRRRRVRGRRPGHARALLLDPARRSVARRDDPQRDGRSRRRDRDDRDPDDHGDPARGAVAGRRASACAKSLGHLHRRDDHPDRDRDGRLPAGAPPGAHPRGLAARTDPVAALDLDRRPRRHRPGLGAGVHAARHHARVAADRLRVRRRRTPGVAAARAPGLSVDLPEDRHGGAARGRDPDRETRPADAGAHALHRRHRVRYLPVSSSRSCSSPSPAAPSRAFTRWCRPERRRR